MFYVLSGDCRGVVWGGNENQAVQQASFAHKFHQFVSFSGSKPFLFTGLWCQLCRRIKVCMRVTFHTEIDIQKTKNDQHFIDLFIYSF